MTQPHRTLRALERRVRGMGLPRLQALRVLQAILAANDHLIRTGGSALDLIPAQEAVIAMDALGSNVRSVQRLDRLCAKMGRVDYWRAGPVALRLDQVDDSEQD